MSTLTKSELARLADQGWRLNNLYKITNKDGQVISFKMNWAQEELFEQMHFKNIVLKARQLGMSTFIGLLQLDTCLFNNNVKAGTIAHNLEAVGSLFRENILFPYEHCHEVIRGSVGTRSQSGSKIEFTNGSSIRVATSLRSGTIQILHISEFGAVCARYPDKAREIVTGTLETVSKGNLVFCESTAEGREGYFYDYCKAAEDRKIAGKEPGVSEFSFNFFPWWKHPDYVINPKGVIIHESRTEYFDKLERDEGIKLGMARRAWYVTKAQDLGEDMMREYPSTPAEAFYQSVHGAYFKHELQRMREEKRITKVAHNPGHSVVTGWDLGVSDQTTIWFAQVIGPHVYIIDYYELNRSGFEHYAQVLREKAEKHGYHYTQHFGPHDLAVFEMGNASTRIQAARNLGINFTLVPRVANKADAIEAERQLLNRAYIDEERCERGVACLDAYRKEWNERLGAYVDRPLHDWASHANDGLQTLARGLELKADMVGARARGQSPAKNAAGWT